MEEKSPLIPQHLPGPGSGSSPRRTKLRLFSYSVFPAICILALLKIPILGWFLYHHDGEYTTNSIGSQCQQQDSLFPSTDNKDVENMWDYLSTEDFREKSIARLSAAVQIPTQSYDDLGLVGEDPRWEIMYEFARFLRVNFPLVHEHMDPEVVNTHGLIYTWEGSDKDLKPLLLMAHQDVVPVPNATVDAWTHPPFSGHYDGKSIWGRGSSDCKNQLIAVMETTELLLGAGFEPKRSIVLSFGFDEEISGHEGAGHLAPYLIERYGKDGIAAIVDEGSFFSEVWGSTVAAPGTGEKGYTDVFITIRMPGGHSSIPSDHTSIGVLSEIITEIESEQYLQYLADDNPYLGQMQCGAAHSPDFPKKLKKLLSRRNSQTHNNRPNSPDYLAIEAAKHSKAVQYLMQTSQAVDVIEGGVKVNALPERVSVTVNHRLNIGDEPEDVWDRITELAKPVAEKYGLKLHAFDGTNEEASSISLSSSDTTLRAAPVTPTNVDENTPYKVLAGTIRALYGEDILVTPGMMTGNTDTRYYWDITKHIFRFGPGYDPEFEGGLGNIHTVDEHISVVNHISTVKWFTMFVRNMDEADLDT